jgi:hypothetical protein
VVFELSILYFGYQCANKRQQHAHSVVGLRGDVRNWRYTNICVAFLRHAEYRFQMLLKETNLKHNTDLHKWKILCSNQIYIVLATATMVQTVFLFVNITTATHLTDKG